MSNEGTSKLNAYLQNIGQLTALSWIHSRSDPKNAPTWTSICKINGEERGIGTDTLKHVSMDIAANEALNSLKAAENSSS